MPEISHPHTLVWLLVAALLVALAMLTWLHFQQQPPPKRPGLKGAALVPRLTDESVTQNFVAAIPRVTQHLNLEIASATQTELFERAQKKTTLWGLLDLGTNVAQIRCPVTYRYHLRLQDPWKLQVRGTVLLVHAPPIRPSLPPAVHTDRMEKLLMRGWARLPGSQLLHQLERDLTPTLCKYATDAWHLELVRHNCRQSVKDFARLCLGNEEWWNENKYTVEVRFANEPEMSAAPQAGQLSG